jgi:Family of unknown function (DUF5681)
MAHSASDYQVGPGRPPLHTRFKKGQSGNPGGRRHCDDDAFPVNIQPNVSDTIRHDPSPMHEARHRPTRRNPPYLHIARRVAPYSGGHVV